MDWLQIALLGVATLSLIWPGLKPIAAILSTIADGKKPVPSPATDPYQPLDQSQAPTVKITGVVSRDAAFVAAETLTRHFEQHNHATGLKAARDAGRALFCPRDPAEQADSVPVVK